MKLSENIEFLETLEAGFTILLGVSFGFDTSLVTRDTGEKIEYDDELPPPGHTFVLPPLDPPSLFPPHEELDTGFPRAKREK